VPYFLQYSVSVLTILEVFHRFPFVLPKWPYRLGWYPSFQVIQYNRARLQVWSKTNLVDVHVRNPYRQGRQHGAIRQFVFLKFYVLLKNQFKGSLKAQLYVCQFTVQGRLDTIT
jgi:hypothetical protein